MFSRHSNRRGFTLIELLIVIGIIGVLASLVIVAINPTKQLCDTQNAARISHAKALQDAVYQYLVGEWSMPRDSEIPEGEENAKPVCKQGVSGDATCVSLDLLAPEYLAAIPSDASETIANYSGFSIYKKAGRAFIVAENLDTCLTEEAASSSSSSSSEAPAPVCGDGTIEAPETCDDGDAEDGDGCSSACTVETDYECSGLPSVCVQMHILYNGHHYYFSQTQETWDSANTNCLAMDGYLLVIGDSAEQSAMETFIAGRQDVWLGLNDRSEEGTFVWENGEGASYTNWHGGQPDNANGGTEHCVNINESSLAVTGAWNDAVCERTLSYVCEKL